METWKETEIETYLFNLLQKESHVDGLLEQYKHARKYLYDNVYSEIKGVEPSLTDHSVKHVINVLENTWKLVQNIENPQNGIEKFNVVDLYLLCMSILLHDVGNIHGRKGHNKNAGDIYNNVVLKSTSKQEKKLIISIVEAHCGNTSNGNSDTLLLVDEYAYIYDKKVRPREIASIVRFADELAEGQQRTSEYVLQQNIVDKDSKLYHYYASIVEVTIDKNDGRIMLTYNISYPIQYKLRFSTVMSMIFERIIKLDTERRYCKYYSTILNNFRETEAQLNFYVNTEPVHLDIPKITLGDRYYLVKETKKSIVARCGNIKISDLQKQLKEIQLKQKRHE